MRSSTVANTEFMLWGKDRGARWAGAGIIYFIYALYLWTAPPPTQAHSLSNIYKHKHKTVRFYKFQSYKAQMASATQYTSSTTQRGKNKREGEKGGGWGEVCQMANCCCPQL